jgi:hypothetical protein
VCGKDSKGNVVCADSKAIPAKVCGQDSKGNKVCADSKREVEARALAVSAPCYLSSVAQCSHHPQPPKVCGQDSKGNKVCAEKRTAEVEARLLKVCGQDSKGNKVCAEKREELSERGIFVSLTCMVLASRVLTMMAMLVLAHHRLRKGLQGQQGLR